MTTDQLVELAESLGLETFDLDGLVHDLAQEVGLSTLNSLEEEDEREEWISSREECASSINNGGLEDQIEFLLAHNDEREVESLIRTVVIAKAV